MVAQPEASLQREIGLATRRTGTRQPRGVARSTNPLTLRTLRRATVAKRTLRNMNIGACTPFFARTRGRRRQQRCLPENPVGTDIGSDDRVLVLSQSPYSAGIRVACHAITRHSPSRFRNVPVL